MYSKCQMYDVNWTRVYQVRDENKILIFTTFIALNFFPREIATKKKLRKIWAKTCGIFQKIEIVHNNILTTIFVIMKISAKTPD